MEEFQVVIPEEHYSILNFETNGLPGVAVVNTALREFEPKEVFSWHLSVTVHLEDLVDNDMPSQSEVEIIDAFGDELDALIKGEDTDKPNALFLARITWNGTRELIWRVFDAETANKGLKDIIDSNAYPRELEYQMNDDEEWNLTEWHLQDYENE